MRSQENNKPFGNQAEGLFYFFIFIKRRIFKYFIEL